MGLHSHFNPQIRHIFSVLFFFFFNINHFSLSPSPANVGTILIFAGGHPGFLKKLTWDGGLHISRSVRAATSSLCRMPTK